MKIKYTYVLILLVLISAGCNKWPTTEDVSHISQLPVFTLQGGDFLVYHKAAEGKFVDPGVSALSDGKELTVHTYDTVGLSKIGVYVLHYFAVNEDGLSATARRIVVVRDIDVTNNDLSGTYTGTWWDQLESKVKKIDPMGLYKVEDIMGYPGAKMPGKFVDMGNNDLVLIDGEGDFGRYSSSEGTYSRSALNWTIFLLDPPYQGVELPIVWHKKD